MPISGDNCDQMCVQVFYIASVVTGGVAFLLALRCSQNKRMFDLPIAEHKGVEHRPEQLRAGFLPEKSLGVAWCRLVLLSSEKKLTAFVLF